MKPYRGYSPESLKKERKSAEKQANRQFRKKSKLTRLTREELADFIPDKADVSY